MMHIIFLLHFITPHKQMIGNITSTEPEILYQLLVLVSVSLDEDEVVTALDLS